MESGMYYCQSRYYVPEWGRWLNGSQITTETTNAFVYAGNNPIGRDVAKSSNIDTTNAGTSYSGLNISGYTNGNVIIKPNWKCFGYEHRTSAGWESNDNLLLSSVIRIGFSSYTTHSTAKNQSVFYSFTGVVESDSLSLLGETYYAGVGMRWGKYFGMEVQVETLGIAGKVNYGNFCISVELNALGALAITIGVDKDLGNGLTSTTGVTIGANIWAVAVLVWTFQGLGSLIKNPSGAPTVPQPGYQY